MSSGAEDVQPGVLHFVGLEDATAIRTEAMALTEQAVFDLAGSMAMGAVHGAAGLGKTFSVAHALKRLDGIEICYFDFPSRTTPKWLTLDLLELLTGVDHDGEHRKLKRELVRILAERPRFVVVDEAQRLNRECIDHLRSLHDHGQSTFSLLLVGGNGCWELLSAHPMLRSRIWRRVEVRPLAPAEVPQIIPLFHPIYRDCQSGLIEMVDDRFAGGVFRNWAGFTKSAVQLMEAGQHKLDRELAEAVFALHGGVQ